MPQVDSKFRNSLCRDVYTHTHTAPWNKPRQRGYGGIVYDPWDIPSTDVVVVSWGHLTPRERTVRGRKKTSVTVSRSTGKKRVLGDASPMVGRGRRQSHGGQRERESCALCNPLMVIVVERAVFIRGVGLK